MEDRIRECSHPQKEKKQSRSRKYSWGLGLLLSAALLFSPIHLQRVYGDTVTDTLEIRLGYSGMALEDYVSVGDYHWGELMENLPMYSFAYSYYKSGDSSGKFTGIVDCANGFLIADILDYAGVYTGDVYNLKFYVMDHQGIQAAFDYDSLFQTRYYFRDFNYNARIFDGETGSDDPESSAGNNDVSVEDENGAAGSDISIEDEDNAVDGEIFTEDGDGTVDGDATDPDAPEENTDEGQDSGDPAGDEGTVDGSAEGSWIMDTDNCWNHAEEVPPMLAIEDNWSSYTQEFDHASEDWTYMNPANRFRLLFGQVEPTESLTSSSAKYVSCVYITLYGNPSYGDLPELDGTYGAHEAEMVIDSNLEDTEVMREALSDLLKLKSTDDSVLKITGYTVTPDSFYGDRTHVTIQYEVVGTGQASIETYVGDHADTSLDPYAGSADGTPALSIDNTSLYSNPGGNGGGGGQAEEGSGKEDKDSENAPKTGQDADPKPVKDTEKEDTQKEEKKSSDRESRDAGNTDGQEAPYSGESERIGTEEEQGAVIPDAGEEDQPEDRTTAADALTEEMAEKTGDTLTEEQTAEEGDAASLQKDGEESAADRQEGSALSAESADLAGYSLTGSAAENLQKLKQLQQQYLPADRDVTEVKVEDTEARDRERQQTALLLLAAIGAGILTAGFVSQRLSFARRRRR